MVTTQDKQRCQLPDKAVHMHAHTHTTRIHKGRLVLDWVTTKGRPSATLHYLQYIALSHAIELAKGNFVESQVHNTSQ